MALAHILIVDDEVQFVEAMSERLAMRDFQISRAFSGPQAMAQLEKEPDIDVVILDLKMPGMSGMEILKTIKTQYPFVQVIMLTGYSTVQTVTEAMKLGAFEYLLKPLTWIGWLPSSGKRQRGKDILMSKSETSV